MKPLLKIHPFISKNKEINRDKEKGIILLHGLGGTVKILDEAIVELNKGGYDCFALDILGFNGSPEIDEDVNMSQHVDYLIRTVDHIRKEYCLSSVAGIGHSFGGQILLCANHDFPDYFERVIAVNSPLLDADEMLKRMEKSVLGRLYHRERVVRRVIRYGERHPSFMSIVKRGSRLFLRSYYRDHIDTFFETKRFNNYFLNTRNVILNNKSHYCLDHDNIILIYSLKDHYMIESDIMKIRDNNPKVVVHRICCLEHNPFIDPRYRSKIGLDLLKIVKDKHL